ncbi:MAG: hypothetical protein M1834_008239 [Cirrosporium novae-zelandiae]|nr:MAG: hypothetical protein M1834_008239 [Cirrosporium novae-zelandiae]
MSPKTIIITGASRGIGLAVAHYLLRAPQSSNLVVLARSKEPLDKLKEQYPKQVQVLSGDLSTDFTLGKQVVDLAISNFGAVDGLIVNHGILDPVARISDSKIEDWQDAFNINVFSAITVVNIIYFLYCFSRKVCALGLTGKLFQVQAALPSLRSSKGCIVLTSSGASINAYSTWGSYGASKAVLNHLALTLKVEEPDVTTISLRPGMVDTAMQANLRSHHIDKMDAVDAAKFRSAFEDKKLLRPEQPGNVMARLVLNPPKDLSGRFLNWSSEELMAYQD